VKRGDLPAPESSSSKPHKKARRGPPGRSLQADPSTAANIDSARKLQSAFVKVSAEFLEETKILASNVPLPRPLPPQASIFPFELDIPTDQIPKGQVAQLSAPKRPKWRFDMSKKEVEKNEEGIFKKWLAQADAIVDDWRHSETRKAPASDAEASSADTTGGNEEASPTGTPPPAIPRAPAHFERNLEVWRQLCVGEPLFFSSSTSFGCQMARGRDLTDSSHPPRRSMRVLALPARIICLPRISAKPTACARPYEG
jgi:hypothetical protein